DSAGLDGIQTCGAIAQVPAEYRCSSCCRRDAQPVLQTISTAIWCRIASCNRQTRTPVQLSTRQRGSLPAGFDRAQPNGRPIAGPQLYAAAAAMFGVGLALASVDGTADEAELALLMQRIDTSFELNDHEQRRLEMRRALNAKGPVELKSLTRKLKRLARPQQAM